MEPLLKCISVVHNAVMTELIHHSTVLEGGRNILWSCVKKKPGNLALAVVRGLKSPSLCV